MELEALLEPPTATAAPEPVAFTIVLPPRPKETDPLELAFKRITQMSDVCADDAYYVLTAKHVIVGLRYALSRKEDFAEQAQLSKAPDAPAGFKQLLERLEKQTNFALKTCQGTLDEVDAARKRSASEEARAFLTDVLEKSNITKAAVDGDRFDDARTGIARLLAACSIMSGEVRYTRQQILEQYHPIDYGTMKTWGGGADMLADLGPNARSLYRALSPLQDQRGDEGHVDTVVWFTLRLAERMELTATQKDAAVHAAILHDTGWSGLDNIAERFGETLRLMDSPDPAVSAPARNAMLELRRQHQDASVQIARERIPGHPFFSEICAVVGDHDTRLSEAPPIFSAFLDADRLWRVTKTAMESASGGDFDRTDPNAVAARLQRALVPGDFTLPWAYDIACIEAANTMLAMARERGWKELPATFNERFAEELKALRAG